mgnify:CR=1 FL=1
MRTRREKLEEKGRGFWAAVSISIVLSSFLVVGAMANDPFAGGWEITSSLDSVVLDGTSHDAQGLHSWYLDRDGNFNYEQIVQTDYESSDLEPTNYEAPGISVSSSYPYYLQKDSAGNWIESSEAWLFDTYDVELTADGSELERYYHWVVGLDVEIKTDADVYYKPGINEYGAGYADYGYYYEDDVIDVDVWTDFSITPWTPSGDFDNWTITGGSSGIFSASVYELEYGLVEEGATENKGHTIQNMNSVNEALNMEGGDPLTFAELKGIGSVPDSVDIQTGAKLGAGAQYCTDGLGHWTE